MNISGLVVRTNPKHLDEVIKSLEESGMCDVHFHDDIGRIIVTIEAESTDEEVYKTKALMALPHVLSVDLVYTYSEDLEKAEHMFEEVPQILKDENVRAEDIVYHGDVKKRL